MVDLRATNEKLQDRSERILMEVLELSRGRARRLLDEAGGSVKTAIAMAWTGGDARTAGERLREVGGRLGEVQGVGGAGDE
jgi:N-acetylmuramic acid 6-phosphate etherase